MYYTRRLWLALAFWAAFLAPVAQLEESLPAGSLPASCGLCAFAAPAAPDSPVLQPAGRDPIEAKLWLLVRRLGMTEPGYPNGLGRLACNCGFGVDDLLPGAYPPENVVLDLLVREVAQRLQSSAPPISCHSGAVFYRIVNA